MRICAKLNELKSSELTSSHKVQEIFPTLDLFSFFGAKFCKILMINSHAFRKVSNLRMKVSVATERVKSDVILTLQLN